MSLGAECNLFSFMSLLYKEHLKKMSIRLLFLWLSDTVFHFGKFISPIWNFYSPTVGMLSPLQIHIGFCYTEISANL